MRTSIAATARRPAARAARLGLGALLAAASGAVAADGPSTVLVQVSATVTPVMCNDPARNPLPACAKPSVSQSVQPLSYAVAPTSTGGAATFDVRVDGERRVVVRTLLY